MSLDKLMNMDMDIVSASKSSQKASDSASAVFVISSEDIKRSGAIYIPDMLRMVPGMFVGKNGSSEWVASPRGFAGKFSGEVLVLIDGRSVFSSLLNNMEWEDQNIHVNDIERIEVIRGPGGTLWGSNAINGVVNIITKSAEDSQHTHISAQGGEGEKSSLYFSHGFTLGEEGYIKVSGHQTEKEGYEGKRTGAKEEDWKSHRVAINAEWEDDVHSFQLSANQYKITSYPFWPNYTITPPYLTINGPKEIRDGYAAQAKFALELSDQVSLDTRFSIDDVDRESLVFKDSSRNLDLDIELNYESKAGHSLTAGINSRQDSSFYTTYELLDIKITPPKIETQVLSIFAQYTHFFTENIRVTAGTKLEKHSEVGKTTQPSLRALWIANEKNRFWASLSESHATPSRLRFSPAIVEAITFAPGALDPLLPIPTRINFIKDDGKPEAQEFISYQLGWRFTPTNDINIDATIFYNAYEKRSTYSAETQSRTVVTATGVYQEIQTFFANDESLQTHGLEIAATWIVKDNWKLKYSGSTLQIYFDERTNDVSSVFDGSSVTRNHADHSHSLRSMWDITDTFKFDIWLRHMDSINNEPELKAYTTVDVRLAWQATNVFDISLGARNLGDNKHVEYNREGFLVDRFYVEDTYSLELSFQF